LALPRRWLQHVQAPQSEAELDALRRSVVRGAPVGESPWQQRTAKRLGSARAVLAYRRTRAEMPARVEEVHHAEQEGIEFMFLVAPVAILGDQKNWVLEQRKDFYEAMDGIKRDMVVQRETIYEGPRWPMIQKRGPGVYGPATEINERNRVINAMLENTVVNADFNAQPMKDVAAFLANAGKVNIQVDPRAKVGDKAAADLEVTFHARQMKLASALAWITRLNSLRYTVRDEVILITDKAHLEDFKVTAVYDISDITAPISESSQVPEFEMTLPSINARRIGYGFYRPSDYWYWHGIGPYTGAFFLDFATVNRYFMTDEEVKDMVDALLEGEDK
jgi:hypothetical protein